MTFPKALPLALLSATLLAACTSSTSGNSSASGSEAATVLTAVQVDPSFRLVDSRWDDSNTIPVRILVGFAAGSGPDLQARTIAQQLATDLKQSFFIENRLGANGTIAARAVATYYGRYPVRELKLLIVPVSGPPPRKTYARASAAHCLAKGQ
jgi:hypothetical protein